MMYYWRYNEIMSGPGVIIVLYLNPANRNVSIKKNEM